MTAAHLLALSSGIDELPEADLFVVRFQEEADALLSIDIPAASIGGGTVKEMAMFNAQMPKPGGWVSVMSGSVGPGVLDYLAAGGVRVRVLPPPIGHDSLLAWVRYHINEMSQPKEIVADLWRDHDRDHAIEETRFGTPSGHPYAPRARIENVVDDAWKPAGLDFLEHAPKARQWLLQHPDGDGLLPLGKAGLLAAQGGAGKTQLVLQLAVSVVTGIPWLGHFQVGDEAVGGRVLLGLAEEDNEEAHRRLYHVAQSMGLSLEQRRLVAERVQLLPLAGKPIALLAHDREGNAHETAILDRLRRHLHRDAGSAGWRLLVLDPLSRWAGLDVDGNNSNATRVIQAIESLVDVPGRPTVLVPVHSSKAARTQGRVDVRGATGLEDAARWVATLAHADDGGAKLRQVKSNYSKPMPDDLILVRGEHGVLRVADGTEKSLFEAKAEAKKMRELEALGRRIRSLIANSKTPITSVTTLTNRLGKRASTVRMAVDMAQEKGWISKAREGFSVGLDPDADRSGNS